MAPSQTTPALRRPSFGLLTVVLVTLVAFFWGQLEARNHAAAVVHVACTEHGVVEDLNGDAAAEADPPTAAPGIRAEAQPESPHDVCSMQAMGGGQSQTPSARVALPPVEPVFIEILALRPATPARAGPPILSFAPKTSPPAV